MKRRTGTKAAEARSEDDVAERNRAKSEAPKDSRHLAVARRGTALNPPFFAIVVSAIRCRLCLLLLSLHSLPVSGCSAAVLSVPLYMTSN